LRWSCGKFAFGIGSGLSCNTPLPRVTQPLRAPPIPFKALKLIKKIDECESFVRPWLVGCDGFGTPFATQKARCALGRTRTRRLVYAPRLRTVPPRRLPLRVTVSGVEPPRRFPRRSHFLPAHFSLTRAECGQAGVKLRGHLHRPITAAPPLASASPGPGPSPVAVEYACWEPGAYTRSLSAQLELSLCPT